MAADLSTDERARKWEAVCAAEKRSGSRLTVAGEQKHDRGQKWRPTRQKKVGQLQRHTGGRRRLTLLLSPTTPLESKGPSRLGCRAELSILLRILPIIFFGCHDTFVGWEESMAER